VTGEIPAFVGVAVVLLASSLAVVLTPNLFHAVLYLAVALVATGVVFLLLDAPFLFGVQLLLYAGGVVAIVVFAIMLTERLVGQSIRQTSRYLVNGGLLAAAVFVGVMGFLVRMPGRRAAPGLARGRHRRGGARPRRPLRTDLRAPRRAARHRPARRALLRAERALMPLVAYLVLAALVFAIGLFGVMTRRNAVGILLGIELMLNAVNINLVAFARFAGDLAGIVFTLFTIAITVAEVAVGLAIVIVIFRVRRTVEADHLDLLRG
jgi:NADH-quinone oxidoreductase subunit K